MDSLPAEPQEKPLQQGTTTKLACPVKKKSKLRDEYVPSIHWSDFSSVQSLSHVRLFVTPWTAARQASLSITNSWSLRKLMSIESVTPSNHLILYHPLLLPSPTSGSFLMSQFFASGGQSIGISASTSVHGPWLLFNKYQFNHNL